MKFDVLTLFPDMFECLNQSIIGRAKEKELIDINLINIRDFSNNKHKKVDDTPYGGGSGMVMMPDVVYRAYESVKTKDANASKQGELGGIKYEILSYERATGKKASIRDSKYVLDKAIKMLDFDPIATLNNFKKTADIGDSTKIQLNNGKVAIVQKEVLETYHCAMPA